MTTSETVGTPKKAATPPLNDGVPPGPPMRKMSGPAKIAYYARFAIDSVGFVGNRFEQYGDIYYAPSTDEGLYVVRSPAAIHDVLVARSADYEKKHTAFGRLRMVLGNGLLTSDGADWVRQRRLLNPVFSRSRVAGYGEQMVQEAIRTVCLWGQRDEVDVGREMADLTLRAVGRTLFNADLADATTSIGKAMTDFHAALATPDVLPAWIPSPIRWRIDRATGALTKVVDAVVAERRRSRQEGQAEDREADVLDRLLDARDEEGDGQGLTDDEVREQLFTLFLAGHETTAVGLTWTFYLLGRHPEVEAKLARELSEVLGGRFPTMDDLPRLTYTLQVAQEAMRLYPPVYAIARRAARDTIIDGYRVPAKSEVIIWTYFTHRLPSIYPDPEAFRPERFEPEKEAKLSRSSYLPFGAGPRLCIGKGFALMEMQLLLASLVQRYRLVPKDDRELKPRPRITLTPNRALTMRLQPR